jgi:hypothetical protein
MTDRQKQYPQHRHQQEKNVRAQGMQPPPKQQTQGEGGHSQTPAGRDSSTRSSKAPAADPQRDLRPSTDQSREREEYGDDEDQGDDDR